jgi:membrane protein implicated in regulation of membrane protease activity
MNWFAIIWLVLFVAFLMAEASTVAVISLWFAIGALSAMIASLFGAELWLQAVLFFAVSIVLLCAMRPLTKKYFTPKIIRTNVDAVVGATGRVEETIQNDLSQGRVKLDGMEWSARSSTGEILEVGTLVKVDRIEGVKVFVTALEVKVS